MTFTTIHLDTFHINYGTLGENRFNNVIVVVTILLTWTLAVATIYSHGPSSCYYLLVCHFTNNDTNSGPLYDMSHYDV